MLSLFLALFFIERLKTTPTFYFLSNVCVCVCVCVCLKKKIPKILFWFSAITFDSDRWYAGVAILCLSRFQVALTLIAKKTSLEETVPLIREQNLHYLPFLSSAGEIQLSNWHRLLFFWNCYSVNRRPDYILYGFFLIHLLFLVTPDC